MMEPTPVYICTGFLDSGKTLLGQRYFDGAGMDRTGTYTSDSL